MFYQPFLRNIYFLGIVANIVGTSYFKSTPSACLSGRQVFYPKIEIY